MALRESSIPNSSGTSEQPQEAGSWMLLVTTTDGETTISTGQASTQTTVASTPLISMEQHSGKETMSKLTSSSSWTPARLEMENWMLSQPSSSRLLMDRNMKSM